MKNNKIFSLGVIGSIFVLAAVYFIVPDVAINVNRIMEMMFTDNLKGITMYYYEFRDSSCIISILASSLQGIIPPISKLAVINANARFFGSGLGIVLSLIGMTLGLSYSYAVGKALSNLILKEIIEKHFKCKMNKYIVPIVFVTCILWFPPFMFIGYISGLLCIDFKRFLPTVILGKTISLCYLLFI